MMGAHKVDIQFLFVINMEIVPRLIRASKKLKRVVSSTFAAETQAAIEAFHSDNIVTKLLSEFLSEKNTLEIDLFTDNRSFYDAVGKFSLVAGKRLRVHIAVIR